MNPQLDSDSVLDRLLDDVGQVMPYDSASVLAPDLAAGLCRVLRQRGFNQPRMPGADPHLPPSINLLAHVRQLVSSGLPLAIADTARSEVWEGIELFAHTRSWAGAPLHLADGEVAVVALDRAEAGFYGAAHAGQLAALAHQAELAMQAARAKVTGPPDPHNASRLLQAIEAIEGPLDLTRLLDLILDHALRLMDAQAGTLSLWDKKAGRLTTTLTQNILNWPGEFSISVGRDRVEQVARSGEAIVFAELEAEAPAGLSRSHPAFHSGVCVPLATPAGVLGAVLIAYAEQRAISPGLMRQLNTFGALAAGRLEQSLRLGRSRRPGAEAGSTGELNQALGHLRDMRETSATLSEMAAQLVGARAGLLALLNPISDELWAQPPGYGVSDPLAARFRHPASEVRQAWPFHEQTLLWVNAGQDLPAFCSGLVDPPGPTSVLAVALRASGRVVGLLFTMDRPDGFRAADAQKLEAFAGQAALVVENARLAEIERQRSTQLRVTQELSRALAATLDADEAAQIVTRRLAARFGYSVVAILSLSQSGDRLELRAAAGSVAALIPANYTQSAGQGLLGRAVRTGQPVIVNDTARDPDFVAIEAWRPAAELCIPIFHAGRVAAVLAADASQTNVFSEDDVVLLQVAGQELLNAWERARLFSETRRRTVELEALADVSSAMRAATSRSEIQAIALHRILEVLNAKIGAIVYPEPDGETLRLAASRGWAVNLNDRPYRIADSISGYVFLTGEPTTSDDLIRDPRATWEATQQFANENWAGAYIPLRAGEQTIGVLFVGAPAPRTFSSDDMRLLIAIAEMAGNALHRAGVMETLEQRVVERTGELAEAKERVEAVLRAAGDALVVNSPDLRITAINPAFEQLTAYAEAEVIHHSIAMLEASDNPPEVINRLREALARGVMWRGEFILRRKDGATLETDLTAAPIRGLEGQFLGSVVSLRDITRFKELDRLKSKFVSDVSHELRTPVANLALYLGLLERGRPEKHPQYLAVLKGQADRLSNLINDILSLSRLELGRNKVQFRPVDLNAVVEQTLVAHLPRAEAAGLDLVFEPGRSLPLIRAESNQLAQIVTNLVANAVNYTPTGRVTVGTQAGQGEVGLCVQDTGMGIEPDELAHLFDRFYRGRRVSQSDTPGTGLGLAIVKEIVDLHEGRIEVQTTVGTGTTFWVWFPEYEAA